MIHIVLKHGELPREAKVAFVDLDGCLFDDSWRLSRIDHSIPDVDMRYAHYHDGIPDDALTRHANAALGALKRDGFLIVIITARPVAYYQLTLKKINASFGDDIHDIFISLIMRENIDHRPAAVIKEQAVKRFLTEMSLMAENCICIDNDQAIIDAYAKLGTGILKLDTNSGSFCNDICRPDNLWALFGDGCSAGVSVTQRCGRLFNQRNSEYRASRLVTAQLLALCIRKDMDYDFGALSLMDAALVKFTQWAMSGYKSERACDDFAGYAVQLADYISADFNANPQQCLAECESVAEAIAAWGENFAKKREEYGDVARVQRDFTNALFPHGVVAEGAKDMLVWHLTEIVITKIIRFVRSGLSHGDSIMDMIVLTAMIRPHVKYHNITVKEAK